MSTFWKSWVIVTLIAIMTLTGAGAEETWSVADVPNKDVQETGTATNHAAGEMPRMVHWLDYTGGLWHSAGLTGDWGSTRQQLMDKGIRQEFYSIGLGGKGLVPGRDNDSFGVGYYYLAISDKLPRVIERRTQDEQGVELYYNIAITPWLHITPDLQVIEPASDRVDTTVVAGVRMKIDF